MAHKIAKLLLEHARTSADRVEAVKSALAMGMPINEIQEYLDWLDMVRGPLNGEHAESKDPPADETLDDHTPNDKTLGDADEVQ